MRDLCLGCFEEYAVYNASHGLVTPFQKKPPKSFVQDMLIPASGCAGYLRQTGISPKLVAEMNEASTKLASLFDGSHKIPNMKMDLWLKLRDTAENFYKLHSLADGFYHCHWDLSKKDLVGHLHNARQIEKNSTSPQHHTVA